MLSAADKEDIRYALDELLSGRGVKDNDRFEKIFYSFEKILNRKLFLQHEAALGADKMVLDYKQLIKNL